MFGWIDIAGGCARSLWRLFCALACSALVVALYMCCFSDKAFAYAETPRLNHSSGMTLTLPCEDYFFEGSQEDRITCWYSSGDLTLKCTSNSDDAVVTVEGVYGSDASGWQTLTVKGLKKGEATLNVVAFKVSAPTVPVYEEKITYTVRENPNHLQTKHRMKIGDTVTIRNTDFNFLYENLYAPGLFTVFMEPGSSNTQWGSGAVVDEQWSDDKTSVTIKAVGKGTYSFWPSLRVVGTPISSSGGAITPTISRIIFEVDMDSQSESWCALRSNTRYNSYYTFDYAKNVSRSWEGSITHATPLNFSVKPGGESVISINSKGGGTLIEVEPIGIGTAELVLRNDSEGYERTCKYTVVEDIFGIQQDYALESGGEPLVIDIRNKMSADLIPVISRAEVTSLYGEAVVEGKLTENDTVLTIEPVSSGRAALNLEIKAVPKNAGQMAFFNQLNYTMVINVDGEGTVSQPENKTVETIAPLDTMVVGQRVMFIPLDRAGKAITGIEKVNSSNPSVATASFNGSYLTVSAFTAGTATLNLMTSASAKANYALEVTVREVQLKSKNIVDEDGTGITVLTDLGGNNIKDGAEVSIELKSVSNVRIPDALNKLVTNDVLGVYEVNLNVQNPDEEAMREVHEDFGGITLSFPVAASYRKNSVKIHHLHEGGVNAGNATSDIVEVQDGKVTITVNDLSIFAIEAVTEQTSASYSVGSMQRVGMKGGSKDPADGVNLVRTGDSCRVLLSIGSLLFVIGLVCLFILRHASGRRSTYK